MVSPIWKASACLTARSAFEAAIFALDSFSPPIACASASASLMRISRSASLTLACCSKAAVSTPIFSSFSSSATRTARSRSAALVPISRSFSASATSMAWSCLALATPIAPYFCCSETSISAWLIAVLAALRPIASM